MFFSSKNPALLLIDIQKGLDQHSFYGSERNNLDAEKNASIILQKWRTNKLPIFHVKHSSQNLASPLHKSKPGFEIKDEVKPINGEPVFVKKVNSAFIGTNLEKTLKEEGIVEVIIVGLTTNHCISTSVRMSSNLGFKTYLISDACAAFNAMGLNGEFFEAELIHQTTLASLNKEFATIINTDGLLLELVTN